MPDSPARAGMEEKLASLETETARLPGQSAKLAQALANVKQMMTAHSDAAPALQPFFDHLAHLDERAKVDRKDIDRQIAESEKSLAACDAIDHATQALKAVPQMIKIAQRPFDFALAFFTSMAASVAPPGAEGPIAAGGALAAGLPKAAGKPTESLAENEIELGSESEIAERLVDRIPESVRSMPGYKFVVAESKTFLPSIVDGLGERNGSLHLFNQVTNLAGDPGQAARVRKLAAVLQEWSERTDDFPAAWRVRDDNTDRITGLPFSNRIPPLRGSGPPPPERRWGERGPG